MRFGVKRTQAGQFARPDALLELVNAVAGLGYDSFWLGDHITFPISVDSEHGETGTWRTDPREDFLEAIATAGFLLGSIADLPIGIHALIAPYRNPVAAGKAIASLDHLSGGRMRLAIAAGWLEEVFTTLGAPPFARRGHVLEEYVEVLRGMWREGIASFEGEHYTIAPSRALPRPHGGRRLPIIVGGRSPAAVRRAGRIGDGWAAARVAPAEAARLIGEFRYAAREAGKDDAGLEIIVELDLDTGSASYDTVIASVAAYRSAGVTLLLLNPMATTVGSAVAELERFSSVLGVGAPSNRAAPAAPAP
jgi:probable F420-dependent oxidoreductase